MSYYSRISAAFDDACRLPLDESSKYVIFSDCHRGTGKANDNFLKNEFIYLAALEYYYSNSFTYVELGDGDELWENRSYKAIKSMHTRVFEVLSKYFKEGRLYAVYGNHDIVKRRKRFPKVYCETFYNERKFCDQQLFPGIVFYSGIIFENKMTGTMENQMDIYLTHGHQADFLNSTLWPVSRFLVRYLWKPLEGLGIPDPTSAAKNNTKKKKSEERLAAWTREKEHILITGHTHHPMMGTKNSPYFNTGSCVSPSGITCIEIENNNITLVEWTLGTRKNQTVYIERIVLGDISQQEFDVNSHICCDVSTKKRNKG